MERPRRCDGHGLGGGQRAIQQSISGAEAAIHDVEMPRVTGAGRSCWPVVPHRVLTTQRDIRVLWTNPVDTSRGIFAGRRDLGRKRHQVSSPEKGRWPGLPDGGRDRRRSGDLPLSDDPTLSAEQGRWSVCAGQRRFSLTVVDRRNARFTVPCRADVARRRHRGRPRNRTLDLGAWEPGDRTAGSRDIRQCAPQGSALMSSALRSARGWGRPRHRPWCASGASSRGCPS